MIFVVVSSHDWNDSRQLMVECSLIKHELYIMFGVGLEYLYRASVVTINVESLTKLKANNVALYPGVVSVAAS